MSAWNCPTCTNSLLEAPAGTAEEGGERPAHLDGATSCSTRCGHLFHVECLMKLDENDDSGRQCPVCHQEIDLEQTNPLRITAAPAGALPPGAAPSGVHQGSGDASTEPPSNSGPGGNPSTRTAAAAFGRNDDSSPSAKRPRGAPSRSDPRPPDAPNYMEAFLSANPEFRPYFTPEMIGRLNAHIDRTVHHLPLLMTLASIQIGVQELQETVDAINQRNQNITEEQVTQAVIDTIANLFLNTEPDRFRELLELVDGGIEGFTQWLNDNFNS